MLSTRQRNNYIMSAPEQVSPTKASSFNVSALKEKIGEELKRVEKLKQAEKATLLKQRLRLLEGRGQLGEARLTALEKIFRHYCTHIFKTGHRVDFDRIVYENQHLTIERFYAFILDFQLNEAIINGEKKLLADRSEITLLFRKCSSNGRNLDLPEFVACVQRLFVLLFDSARNFPKKMQKLAEEKAARLKELQRREMIKMQRQKAKQNGDTLNLQPIEAPVVQPPNQNDSMVQDMMKNFEIVNPTEEINLATSALQGEDEQLYSVTNEEKIESYLLRIGIDNLKQLEKKMRYFEKQNVRFTEEEEMEKHKKHKSRLRINQQEVSKEKVGKLSREDSAVENNRSELVSSHDEWGKDKKMAEQKNAKRLLSVKEQVAQRQMQKSKSQLARCLSKQDYIKKKQRMDESFEKRQRDLMFPTAKQRITMRQQEGNTAYYNLDMIHRSSPGQLALRPNPQRYMAHDPSDSVFLHEYPADTMRPRMQRGESSVIESARRRAAEVQQAEARKASRYAIHMYKNHHYLEKFLQRRW